MTEFYAMAADWCAASTQISSLVYGDDSIEYAQELYKLAQLRFNAYVLIFNWFDRVYDDHGSRYTDIVGC